MKPLKVGNCRTDLSMIFSYFGGKWVRGIGERVVGDGFFDNMVRG